MSAQSIGGLTVAEKKQNMENFKRDVTGSVLEQLVNDVLSDRDILGVVSILLLWTCCGGTWGR